MGVTVDCGEFLIIRPTTSYRLHSSVIIIKGEEPVIIDTGTTLEPGLKRIKEALKFYEIDPLAIKYIILTHSHQDHVLQLFGLQKYCRNAKVICHKKDLYNIQHPTSMEKSWQKALKLLGRPQSVLLLYRIMSGPAYLAFYRSVNMYPQVHYVVNAPICQNGFDLKKFPKLQVKGHSLHLIPTPGHSAGHMCVYDSNIKVMFLGDFVPFTPWINPLPEALDNMIQSIKNFSTITKDDVEYAVSAHGDIRKENWEITDWDCIKEKFELFLKTIYDSLQQIPKILKKRPLTAESITQLLIPQYRRYLWVMRVLFIPPALTWILAYCQKLEQLGKIKRISQRNKILWTA